MNYLELQASTWQLYKALQQQNTLHDHQGTVICSSPLEQVMLFYSEQAATNEVSLYEPGLVFVMSGKKCGQLGQYQLEYDREHVLILTSTYPIQFSVQASRAEPLFGICIRTARAEVRQLIHDIDQHSSEPISLEYEEALGIDAHPLGDAVRAEVGALVKVLHDPIAAKLFGENQIRAIFYTLMRDPKAASLLRRWAAQEGQFAQFQKAIEYIQSHSDRTISLDELAQYAGMSVSTLNRSFHRYVADSPVQYIKKVRLNLAKLMLNQGQSVQVTASRVGYESNSQFSREFKRYFGHSPVQAKLAGLKVA